MPRIYSTLVSDIACVDYADAPEGGIPVERRRVVIKGGANRPNKHGLITPSVGTDVTDDQLAFLMTHSTFQRYVDTGYFSVHGRKVDPEVAAAPMTARDTSAPLLPEDLGPGSKLHSIGQTEKVAA